MQAARKLKVGMAPIQVEQQLDSYMVGANGENIQFRAFLLTDGGLYSKEGVPLGTSTSLQDFDMSTNRVVGRGASGEVSYIVNKRTNTPMALKRISIVTKEHRDEIEKELQLLCRNMSDDHIVRNYTAFWNAESSEICIPMEWLAYSLHDLSKFVGAFQEQWLAAVAFQFTLGLRYLHEHKIVHRDIKTSNTMVSAEGVVKLGDFGISKIMHSNAPIATTFTGTQIFMAPERLETSEYSFPSDIWSFGLMLVALSHGCINPWLLDGGTEVTVFQLMGRMRSGAVPMLPHGFSHVCQNFVSLCLQVDPDARPPASVLLNHPFLASMDETSARSVVKSLVDRVTSMAVNTAARTTNQPARRNPQDALQELDNLIDEF